MITNLKKNNHIIITFILPLVLSLIGFLIYKDYGISFDEEITRNNGLISIKYICDFFFGENNFNLNLIRNLPNLENYTDRQYGTFFEIFLIFVIEILLEIREFSEIFYYRFWPQSVYLLLELFSIIFLHKNF